MKKIILAIVLVASVALAQAYYVQPEDNYVLEKFEMRTIQKCDTTITINKDTKTSKRQTMEISCRDTVVLVVLWKRDVPEKIDLAGLKGYRVREKALDERNDIIQGYGVSYDAVGCGGSR